MRVVLQWLVWSETGNVFCTIHDIAWEPRRRACEVCVIVSS